MVHYIDDENMIYDLKLHRYILTVDGYETLSGESVTTDHGLEFKQADRMLKRVSNIVYNFIYSWAKNPHRTEYEISLPKYREYIQEALTEMMTGLLANKTDISLFFTSDNVQMFKNTDLVTPQVKQILMNSGILTRAELPILNDDYDKNRGVDY